MSHEVSDAAAADPAPAPQADVDVPQWIWDLVPVAERARGLLLTQLPWLVCYAVVTVAALAQGSLWATLTVPLWGAILGLSVSERGRAEDVAGASVSGGRVGPDGSTGSGRERAAGGDVVASVGADVVASVGADGVASVGGDVGPGRLRPGGRAFATLAAADITASALGLLVWAGGAVVDHPHPFLMAATSAGAAMATAGLGVLVREGVPGRSGSALVLLAWAAVVAGCGWGVWLGVSGRASLWWTVVVVAVCADVVGAVAVVVGRVRGRRVPGTGAA